MRVTFVALGWEQLGVSLLSAVAKQQGHEVSLAFSASLFNDRYNLNLPALARLFDDRQEVLQTIQRQKPDVLAFSALTGTYQWMLGIAREAKRLRPEVKVVFGGVHASAVPERVLAQPHVDYVCVGEGDAAFPLILKAIEQRDWTQPIPNTRYKLSDGRVIQGPQTGFIQDLDSLPMFDKTLWEEHIRIRDWYMTMASRGCPYRCTFCFNSFFAKLPGENPGKYVRQRSVEHMMHELRWAKKRYQPRFLEFEDDVFTVDKKWLKEFLGHYKREIRIPFQCLTHPQYMDDETARWLAHSGCQYVQMGIQSMDEGFKRRTIKRCENNEKIEKAMEAMRRWDIRAKVDHMFGLPGEPLQAQEAAREFYLRYPPYRIQTFWTNFLPGTAMLEEARRSGRMTQEQFERLNDGEGFDFYRDSTVLSDPRLRKVYKSYELCFKLIPVLPDFLRRWLRPGIFARWPLFLCSWMSFGVDAVSGLVKSNPDHFTYARHYLSHMIRFLKRKLSFRIASSVPAKMCHNVEEKIPCVSRLFPLAGNS